MASWQAQHAETHFSELLSEAEQHGPQIITESGADRAVLISIEEYALLRKREPTVLEVLLSGPKLEDDDHFFEALKRDPKDVGRDPDL